MRIVSISDDFLERFAAGDREFMQKHGRPCLLVVRLKFRGKRRDFAVPFRSNIAPNVPKDQYFALPLARRRGRELDPAAPWRIPGTLRLSA